MDTIADILGNISGGKVLDVATGGGGFVHFLMDGLHDFDEITGIDLTEKAKTAFMESFQGDPRIHFQLMDAEHPTFADSSFDVVCVSNSLHHFRDPFIVLNNMVRMLRPGGTLIVSEMVQDGQSETQMTHVLLHHWWGSVDRRNDIFHNETYKRKELIDLVELVGLEKVMVHDLLDCDNDPMDPAIKAELKPVMERYIQRAEGDLMLHARGKELLQRLDDIGFHSATTVIITGKKSVNSIESKKL